MTPPLQASRVAILVAASRASFRADAGPASASSRSQANPAGSRVSAMTGARWWLGRVSIQASPGRITSPQASISSPDDRSPSSQAAFCSCSRSQASGSSTHEAPRLASTPDASQRCCQVSPGNDASQRRTLAVPRRRAARAEPPCDVNGGEVRRRSVSSWPWAVSGHHDWAGRGGNCSRSWLLRRCCSGAVAGDSPGLLRAMCLTAVTRAARTEPTVTAGYSLVPAAGAVPPAPGTGGRGGRARPRSPRPGWA